MISPCMALFSRSKCTSLPSILFILKGHNFQLEHQEAILQPGHIKKISSLLAVSTHYEISYMVHNRLQNLFDALTNYSKKKNLTIELSY